MSVDVLRFVQTFGGSLITGQAIALETDYQRSSALLLGVLLLMAGEDIDRLVERLVEENRALRELLGAGADLLGAGEVATDLQVLAAEIDPGLRITALQATNDRLRRGLIRLHAAVEDLAGGAARAFEDRLWAELARSVERRRLVMSPF